LTDKTNDNKYLYEFIDKSVKEGKISNKPLLVIDGYSYKYDDLNKSKIQIAKADIEDIVCLSKNGGGNKIFGKSAENGVVLIITNKNKGKSAEKVVKDTDKVYELIDGDLFVYFPGANDGATSDSLLSKYVTENLIYPDSALKAKIEGEVFVEFTIGRKGQISNIKITKGSNPYFDKEVIRLISAMPNWIWDEKIKMTHRVVTTRTLPIKFSLE
jgi:TonB family protein